RAAETAAGVSALCGRGGRGQRGAITVASTEAASYAGTENLEVMKEAELYNRYLTRLITTQMKSGDTVLDFGAGVGTFAYPLRARGLDPICVEPDAALRNGLDRAGFRTHAGLADIANA